MHKQTGEDYQADPESLRRGYESSEITGRGILWFAIIFVSILIFIHGAIWVTFRVIVNTQAQTAEKSPLAEPPTLVGPALQPSTVHNRLPWQDVKLSNDAASEKLSGYGWVDQASGIVHIPIEQAMQVVVDRQAAPGASTGPTSRPR